MTRLGANIVALVVAIAVGQPWSHAAAVAALRPADLASSHHADDAAPSTGNAGAVSGPSMTLDQTEMAPGGRVIVTLDGFGSTWATVMVCGNEARRGSPDCNQTGSTTKEFPADGGPLRISLAIATPPTDCPCVIRAVGRDTSEIAIAPMVVTGHPVGAIVEPDVAGPLMRVEMDVSQVSRGVGAALRAQLGGPATYDVTVQVTNTSASPLRAVRLSAAATRGDAIVAAPAFDDPGQLGVGQTWSQTVTAQLPAPSFGEVEWHATASGAGPLVEAQRTTSHRPVLLIILVLLVVLDLAVLLIRWRMRRRLEPDRVTMAGRPSGRATPRRRRGARFGVVAEEFTRSQGSGHVDAIRPDTVRS